MNTEHEILSRLSTVAKRRLSRAILRSVAHGLLYGSAIALVIGVVRLAVVGLSLHWAFSPEVSKWLLHWGPWTGLSAAALLGGALIGASLTMRRKPSPRAALAAAATDVDRHYGLHDRTISALRFLEKTDPSPLEEAQIADCTAHVAQLDPRAVVPGGLPKSIFGALALSALTAATIVTSLGEEPPKGRPGEPLPGMASPGEPPNDKPSPQRAATDAPFAAALEWQAALPGEVMVGRLGSSAGATLEEIVSTVDQAAEATPADAAPKRTPTGIVLQYGPLSLERRQMVRRYFESIRSDAAPAPAPAAP
jgi:hypothetical protein